MKSKTKPVKQKEYTQTLPDGTGLNDAHIEILKKLNNDYTHVVFGGKNVVIGQRNCQVQGSVFTFEALPEFKKRFLNQPLVGGGVKVKTKGMLGSGGQIKIICQTGQGFILM